MVRHQIYRRKKYEAKIDGTVAEMRVEAYRDKMVEKHTAMQTILVEGEEAAKTEVLEPCGVPVNMIPHYLNAKREFCRLARNFTENTLLNEALNTFFRFEDRGFDTNILILLANQCGIDLWAYYEY